MADIWLSKTEIAALPASGAAWDVVKSKANGSWGTADIHDSNYVHNIGTLGGALYAARTGDGAMKNKTAAALKAVIGTEAGAKEGGQTPGLAVSRKLCSYAIAADLIGYTDAGFLAWIKAMPAKKLSDGMSVISIHEKRPNNFGTMAAASRVAVDLLVSNTADLAKAVTVHQGWLGDRAKYAGFDYGGLEWQSNKSAPVGINPKGAQLSISGAMRNVDGVQAEDQRRTPFAWPPPKGNYPWDAMGSILVTTELLRRAGQDARQWSDQAPLRAIKWLYGPNANPPTGNDCWQPSLIMFLYDGTYPGGNATAGGRNMAFTQWSHGGRKAGGIIPPPTPEPAPTPPSDPCAQPRQAVKLAQEGLATAEKALADCEAKNA